MRISDQPSAAAPDGSAQAAGSESSDSSENNASETMRLKDYRRGSTAVKWSGSPLVLVLFRLGIPHAGVQRAVDLLGQVVEIIALAELEIGNLGRGRTAHAEVPLDPLEIGFRAHDR